MTIHLNPFLYQYFEVVILEKEERNIFHPKIILKKKNLKNAQKSIFFKTFFYGKIGKTFLKFNGRRKKMYKKNPLSFPILGIRDSTRGLQFTLFQNPLGVALAFTEEQQRSTVEQHPFLIQDGLFMRLCFESFFFLRMSFI